jgi:hypothetical protein
MPFDEVPAVCSRIDLANDDVRVHLRLILLERNISDQRQDLDLFLDGDVLIPLRTPIEIRHDRVRERADRREVAGGQPLFSRKGGEHGDGFVIGRQDEHERS